MSLSSLQESPATATASVRPPPISGHRLFRHSSTDGCDARKTLKNTLPVFYPRNGKMLDEVSGGCRGISGGEVQQLHACPILQYLNCWKMIGWFDWLINFPFSDTVYYLEWPHFALSLSVISFRWDKGLSPQIYLSEHFFLLKMLNKETGVGLLQTLYLPLQQQQEQKPSKLTVPNADDNLRANENTTSRKNRTRFNPFQVVIENRLRV